MRVRNWIDLGVAILIGLVGGAIVVYLLGLSPEQLHYGARYLNDKPLIGVLAHATPNGLWWTVRALLTPVVIYLFFFIALVIRMDDRQTEEEMQK